MDDQRANAKADERWRALIEQYGRYLRRLLTRLCPRNLGLELDDVEQEARLRLWKALRDEREIEDPASYLYRIATTATIDAIRRVRARREEPLADPEEEGAAAGAALADAGPPLDQAAGRGLLLERIGQVLGTLPADRRRVLELHLQGFTTQEIGDLHGWTEAKARNLVYRTLADLRDRLKAQGIEYEGD
jgi:RNA polymerase sigma-70 factor, ECF subfamily